MSAAEELSPYMTAEEAASYLRKSLSWLYKRSMRCEIPVRKHGAQLVFVKSELDEWSDAQFKKEREPSISKFQSVRQRLRSLKTEDTVRTSRKG